MLMIKNGSSLINKEIVRKQDCLHPPPEAAGLALTEPGSPICAGLRSRLIIVDGVTIYKEQIAWL